MVASYGIIAVSETSKSSGLYIHVLASIQTLRLLCPDTDSESHACCYHMKNRRMWKSYHPEISYDEPDPLATDSYRTQFVPSQPE